ncbi:MAG: alkaline phosphatase D family protein [Solirubrobacteraceae bacterium]
MSDDHDPLRTQAPGSNRRLFLQGALASAASLALPATARADDDGHDDDDDVRGTPPFAYPFTLGVAAGDPLPEAVVIWTRLAPAPLTGGGMPERKVTVRSEVARDERFRHVVRRGTAPALPELAHSVHVDVGGLKPGHEYFYRFRVGRHESRIGRMRTAPPRRAMPAALNFAFVSCQDWQAGFYPAFRDVAAQDLDLLVHLGDYIYEYGVEPGGPRVHDGPEVESLASYRNRHALYKTDDALQQAHASCAWIVTTDDHEVENNYADLIREEGAEPNSIGFAERRANAYQAYYEHMPLRRSSLPQGPDMLLYRRLSWGALAEFSVLDTRQYRTDQPCGDGLKSREGCPESLDPTATMTGPDQERWLLQGLARSNARWNVIGQQTMLAEYDFNPLPSSTLFNMDQWDGYVAARNRLLRFLMDDNTRNPIVLTGDIHSSWVHDLKSNFDDPGSRTLGTEFVGTSISSDFPAPFIAPIQAARVDNPHTKFFDGQYRGYVRCTVTPDRWVSNYRAVPTVLSPAAPAFTLASFEVGDGQPGAVALSPVAAAVGEASG